MKTAKPLGYILYEGPSQIDGAPIVVIVNKIDGSDNAKTGAMVQTFIIRSDRFLKHISAAGMSAPTRPP